MVRQKAGEVARFRAGQGPAAGVIRRPGGAGKSTPEVRTWTPKSWMFKQVPRRGGGFGLNRLHTVTCGGGIAWRRGRRWLPSQPGVRNEQVYAGTDVDHLSERGNL